MFLHVEKAKYLNDYRVWPEFNDGTSGEVDLASALDGPIFIPLKNPNYFKTLELRSHTLTCDNGADFAPEFLKALMEKQSVVLS
jgi:Protein of unknown function (DUF2442)